MSSDGSAAGKITGAMLTLISREAFILLIYMAAAASVLNIFLQSRSFREGITPFSHSRLLD